MSEQELAHRQDNAPVSMLAVIERFASSPDVDVAKLERMLDMQERIMAKNAETAFNSAMAKMQAELPVITETGKIVHKGTLISTYAKFEDINDAVKPILRDHGFAVSFKTDTSAQQVKVTCILTHSEGHRETTDIVLPADTGGAKNAVQAVASSVSYGKRYTMEALLNITSRGQDDDGQAAVQVARITPDQIADLEALIQEVGANEQQFCRFMMAKHLGDIRADQYQKAVKALEAKRKQNA